MSAPDDKKPAALERLVKLAEFTEKNWPDRPEADDGRMARAEAKLFAGQTDEALAIFERVNPLSDRYPLAAYMAGQNYWRLYLIEKAKPEKTRNNERMASHRAKAIERLSPAWRSSRNRSSRAGPCPGITWIRRCSWAKSALKPARPRRPRRSSSRWSTSFRRKGRNRSMPRCNTSFWAPCGRTAALGDLEKAGKVADLLIESRPRQPPGQQRAVGLRPTAQRPAQERQRRGRQAGKQHERRGA